VRRTSAKGSTFVTAQVRCNADDGESVLCSVIAFQASTAEALAGLAAGDTVAVAGPAALSQWEKNGEHKVGLKVTYLFTPSVLASAAGAMTESRSVTPVRCRPAVSLSAPGRLATAGAARPPCRSMR